MAHPLSSNIRKLDLQAFGLLAIAAVVLGSASCSQLRADPPDPNVGVNPTRDGGRGGSGTAGSAGTGPAMGGGAGGETAAGGGAAADSGAGGSVDAPGMGAPACPVGTTRCAASGPAVEVCTVAGQWVMDKTCPSICTNGACAGMCTPSELQCGSNGTPEKCSERGEWVPQAQPCEFVCTGKGECTGECKPGLTRCGDPPNTLTSYKCDEKGKWLAGTTCMNVCLNGSCGGSCPPGKIRCNSNRKELCGPMGTWDPAETCPFVCTGEGNCTGDCKPGSKRCDGQTPQVCDAGTWRTSPACSGKTCLNGACVGSCAPGDRQCSGNTPQTCDAGNWKSAAACSGKTCVDGACAGVCAPTDKQCGVNNTPQTCSGGSWRDGTACSGKTCLNGACAGECEKGQKRCNAGTTPQTCSDRGSYTGSTACSNHFRCVGDGECSTTMCAASYDLCGSSCLACNYGCQASQSRCRVNALGTWYYCGDFRVQGVWMSVDITSNGGDSVTITYHLDTGATPVSSGKWEAYNSIRQDAGGGLLQFNDAGTEGLGSLHWIRQKRVPYDACTTL